MGVSRIDFSPCWIIEAAKLSLHGWPSKRLSWHGGSSTERHCLNNSYGVLQIVWIHESTSRNNQDSTAVLHIQTNLIYVRKNIPPLHSFFLRCFHVNLLLSSPNLQAVNQGGKADHHDHQELRIGHPKTSAKNPEMYIMYIYIYIYIYCIYLYKYWTYQLILYMI